MLQVVVLDGGGAKNLSNLLELFFFDLDLGLTVVLALDSLLEGLQGSLLGFVKELLEFDGLSSSGLDLLGGPDFFAVLIDGHFLLQYHSKLHVIELDLLGVNDFGELPGFENLFEVKFLANISNVDNTLSLALIDSVSQSGQISGGIPKASVRLLDHQGWSLLLANEDADSSLVLDCDSSFLEFLHEWSQEWVIERFTSFLEFDVHSVVKLLELDSAELAEHSPASKAFLITRLKSDDVFLRDLLEGLILIKSLLGSLVEGLEITDVWLLLNEIREVVVQLLDQHSKLSAPVSNVVDSLDVVTKELKDPTNAVSLDGGPQVSHVHVLRNVGT